MKLLTLIAVVLMAVACSIPSTYITGDVREPISPSEVVVYLTPPDGYEEIALIETGGGGKKSTRLERMMDDLKEEAAKLGANGVILLVTDERQVGTYAPEGQNWEAPVMKGYAKGVAIFKPQSQPQR